MSQVIVLLENEISRSQFLDEFGLNPPNPNMCRIQTESERRIFRYEVFGLLTLDKKIQDLISQKLGIVIIINNINKENIDRIFQIIKSNSEKLLLLVYENSIINQNNFLNMFDNSFLNLFIVNNRKFIFSSNKFSVGKNWFYENIQNILKSQKNKNLTQSSIVSSKTININDMVTQFEMSSLPLEIWDHFGRLRIVDYYLTNYGYNKTIDINGPLCVSWKKYKTSVGHEKLWNYTLTRFWTNILYSLHKKEPNLTFEQIYEKYTYLQFGSLFKKYYSDDVIFSQKAKNSWVEPNLTCGN